VLRARWDGWGGAKPGRLGGITTVLTVATTVLGVATTASTVATTGEWSGQRPGMLYRHHCGCGDRSSRS
jgi:hypothetical protein